jgi:hypothetical protein
MLPFPKTYLIIVTLLLTVTFHVWAENYQRPKVVVSVYNDAEVSERALGHAEQTAAGIFNKAGIDILWKNCNSSRKYVGPDALVRAGEQSSPGSLSPIKDAVGLRPIGRVGTPAPTRSRVETLDCSRFEWPTHLAVRVVSRSGQTLSRTLTDEVFGVAFLSEEGTGCYIDVFYDRVLGLNADWNVSPAEILGTVIAHELGHLLLGSNSHSDAGIMKARWEGGELGRLSRGNLWFTSEQRGRMIRKLESVPSGSNQLAVSARPPL